MDNLNLKKKNTNIEVEFQLLVQMALNQRVSWGKLKLFLHDLASTYETSKKLNDVLLDELQSLHVKANESKLQVQDSVQDDEIMVLFSKQETIEDTIESQGTSDDFSDEIAHIEINNVKETKLYQSVYDQNTFKDTANVEYSEPAEQNNDSIDDENKILNQNDDHAEIYLESLEKDTNCARRTKVDTEINDVENGHENGIDPNEFTTPESDTNDSKKMGSKKSENTQTS